MRQTSEAHRSTLGVADNLIAGENKAVACTEVERLRDDLAEPHLRPRKIGHNSDLPPDRTRGRADGGYYLPVLRKVTVRKVDSSHINACSDQAVKHLR